MRLVRLPASALTLLCAALTLGPLLLLTYLAIARSTEAVEGEAKARISSTALVGADFVNAELAGLAQLVESYAGRRLLARDLRSGSRRNDLRRHLHGLRGQRTGIAVAFAADPQGRLLDIVPETASIVGRDFSSHDWYRGVMRTGRPYVSEAHVTAAKGNDRVVAAATLVRDEKDGRPLGILVAAYSLSHVQRFTERLARDQGVLLTVTDQRGVVVAAPDAGPRVLRSQARDPLVQAALRGETGMASHTDDTGESFSAYTPVPDFGWTVTASVPRAIGFARAERVRETVLLTAAPLALALVAGIGVLGLTLRRRQEAEQREREALAVAEARNEELAEARDELELRNAELEAQTAALAQTHALLEIVVKEVEHEKAHVERLATINGAVLDATIDGIGLVDLDGTFVLRNAALRRLLEELGLDGGDNVLLEALPLAKEPEQLAAFVRRLRDEPAEESSTEFDFFDPERTIRVHTGLVRSEEGVALGRIFVTRDVTRERRAERAKSELVATVAHELRTPLTGILGFAELLAEADVDGETRRTCVETIVGEALRLKTLVDDFLDLHRIETGNFTLALAPVAFDELVAAQARFYEAQSPAHTIEVDVEPGLTVLGERDRLAQVLANLLTNAIKYSPAGGLVRITATRSGPSVCVEVRDSGIGIPADQQPRVFEKFFRVDSSDTRRIGGTGLGLTLSRDIVESHGGRIEFDSVEGEGSTFRVVLPSAADPTSGRQRVLIVEDDHDAAELLRVYLEEDGYEVDVAATGEEALARADQRPPAMICLDIGLAGRLDGWAVLTRLKDSARTAGIPVVICSGSDAHRRAFELGATGFLRKPVDRERLLEGVHEFVDGQRGTVLVVDDDENVRSFLSETLAREGLEVQLASNGKEGIELARRHRPDLLLLDLLMPDMDGIAVLEELEVDERLREIPVVVLTADHVDEPAREHLRERTISFLEKRSYSAGELRQLVEQVLAA